MDNKTESLKQLIDSKDIINWKVAIKLVKNLDRRYKFYLLYFMKKRIPRFCFQCYITYGESVTDRYKLIMEYNADNNLTIDRIHNLHINFNEHDTKWINEYIKDTELEYIQQDPCCEEDPYDSKREEISN